MAARKDKTKPNTGRPTLDKNIYSKDKTDRIFIYMIENKCGFTKSCLACGVSITIAYQWLSDNKQMRDDYARAHDIRADMLFEEAEEEARKVREGDIVTTTVGTNDGKRINKKDVRRHDAVDRSKLIVDTIKWQLGRMKPKKYGAGVEAPTKEESPDNNNIVITGGLPDDEPAPTDG